MTSAARRERILELIKSQGYTSIDDLVARFELTPQTLRGDLNRLADEGRLIRQAHPSPPQATATPE